MKTEEKYITQGYALAVAEVIRFEDGWSTLVGELVRAFGLTYKSMKAAQVDDYDLREFRKAARGDAKARADLRAGGKPRK